VVQQPSKDNLSFLPFRPIQPQDNPHLAAIIRAGIIDMGVPTQGTAYSDPTTDHLFELFQTPGAYYHVCVSDDHEVMGGCGVYPTPGLPAGCAEMVRFFLKPSAQGRGLGYRLMRTSIYTAQTLGYSQLYIETFPEMKAAVHLYEHAGFEYLPKAMGNSGHPACTVWMMKGI
jgi:putative acetyltransferase